MGRTYEIQIPSKQKSELCLRLDALNHSYVDASFDEFDLAEESGAEAIEKVLREEELPITLYFTNEPNYRECLVQLKNIDIEMTVNCRDYDDQVWQQAWEPEEKSFCTERFSVELQGESSGEREFTISLDSKGAFGSGQHATTKAILRLLEEESHGQGALLDVGTGTGILAIAAERLGYSQILATDIDEVAIKSAEFNRKLNDCSFEILCGDLPSDNSRYHMIVSNILPPVINNLLPNFLKRLENGGKVILAGFNEANKDQVIKDSEALGLTLKAEQSERGWLAYCFQL